MRRLLALLCPAVLAAVVAASAEPARDGAFTFRGTVTSVADGDTISVRLDNGRRERVRLVGIDTPERGACLAGKATGLARQLADDERVLLRGDATQDTRDRYGRLLAYAWVRGRDLGFQMVSSGLARVYVYDRPFQRLSAYRRAEQAGRRRTPNVWRGCATPAALVKPRSNCDASYRASASHRRRRTSTALTCPTRASGCAGSTPTASTATATASAARAENPRRAPRPAAILRSRARTS